MLIRLLNFLEKLRKRFRVNNFLKLSHSKLFKHLIMLSSILAGKRWHF